ncbi:MAG: DUF6512 family protein [Christensenellales bacterium]|jgi:hypothetical protein
MKKRNILFFILTVLLGGALHFLFEWTGKSVIAALFSPVNESVWEHLKILATPFLLLSAVEYGWYGKSMPNFFAAKALALWAGLIFIVAGYYTYTGILGKDFVAADIALSVAGAAAAWLYSYRLLKKGKYTSKKANARGLAAIVLTLLCFFVFTFVPPKIALFRDPETGTFGVRETQGESARH